MARLRHPSSVGHSFKHLKSYSSELKGWEHETWYAAFGTLVIQTLYKWLSWVDLYILHGKVKFASYDFVWFYRNYWSPWNAVWYIQFNRRRHMRTRGQGHCLTFVKGLSNLYFRTSSFGSLKWHFVLCHKDFQFQASPLKRNDRMTESRTFSLMLFMGIGLNSRFYRNYWTRLLITSIATF